MGVLLLVRHGQASFGAADYDVLSEHGRAQATLLGDRLRVAASADARSAVGAVVSGDLRRQKDTARTLLQAWDRPAQDLHVDPRWDEYDSLDVLTGVPADDDARAEAARDGRALQVLLDQGLLRWTSGRHDGDYREPWPVYRDRVAAALHAVAGNAGTTVVVSSAGTIAAACGIVLDAPPALWTALARTAVNTAVTKIVSGRSGISLVSVNDHAHLESGPGLVTYR